MCVCGCHWRLGKHELAQASEKCGLNCHASAATSDGMRFGGSKSVLTQHFASLATWAMVIFIWTKVNQTEPRVEILGLGLILVKDRWPCLSMAILPTDQSIRCNIKVLQWPGWKPNAMKTASSTVPGVASLVGCRSAQCNPDRNRRCIPETWSAARWWERSKSRCVLSDSIHR